MNYLTRLIWLGLLLLWSGCNRFIDQQPTPDTGPPAGSVGVLSQMYPQAGDIVFTTLLPNQLWRATFVQQRHRYQALTSPTQMLLVDQLVEGILADSITRLLEPTVMAGGTFSNPRIRHYEWNRTVIHPSGRFIYHYADYTWQGQPYTMYWTIAWPPAGRPFYNLYLQPFQEVAYDTKALTDLPESIQSSLRQQGMSLSLARIQLDGTGKRRYLLSVQQPSAPPAEQYWQFTYDDNGQILAAVNDATAQFSQQLDQLPPAIQQYMQRPEMAGFTLSGSVGRHTYGPLITYALKVQKDKQYWDMLFTGDGQLISRTFLVVGSF